LVNTEKIELPKERWRWYDY